MKGHERPLTFLKYSREGDLLFSCAKDSTPTVWFADNGERLGTYKGHNGAVWCCDISRELSRFLTSVDRPIVLVIGKKCVSLCVLIRFEEFTRRDVSAVKKEQIFVWFIRRRDLTPIVSC